MTNTKYVYQSAGKNSLTFGDQVDPDNTFRVSAVRSWADSAKVLRFNRLSLSNFRYVYVAKPNCADKCLDLRSTEVIKTELNSPAPRSEDERKALIAAYVAHSKNVLQALEQYNVISGSLPPNDAVFEGTYVSVNP